MIEYLEWDSNFFDCKIGKVISVEGEKFPELQEFNRFDLVYIFSKNKLNQNFTLFDIKITYHKRALKRTFPNSICFYDASKHSYQDLLELAYLSGHDSRFLKDSFFGEKAFKKLYKAWVDNGLKDSISQILVYTEKNKILGFTIFKNETDKTIIDLIAVNRNAQGKGVGVKLLNAVESLTEPSTNIYVSTQETNKTACNFYIKCGFHISNKNYIYHYHYGKDTL